FDLGSEQTLVSAEECQKAGEVAGITHVHAVADRRHRRTCLKRHSLKVFGYHVINISGSNEMIHRQAHPLGQNSRCQIAKVPAWPSEGCLTTPLGQSGIGTKLIAALGYPPCYIDGVGRSKHHPVAKSSSEKRFLDHSLAIIKSPFHF